MNKSGNSVPFLEMKGLCKSYHIKNNQLFRKSFLKAVQNCSLSIQRGEVFGLVGESGCGKSTLGKMLANVIKPTSGEIIFKGLKTDLLATKQSRKVFKAMQIIFQDPYSSLNPKKKIGWILEEP